MIVKCRPLLIFVLHLQCSCNFPSWYEHHSCLSDLETERRQYYSLWCYCRISKSMWILPPLHLVCTVVSSTCSSIAIQFSHSELLQLVNLSWHALKLPSQSGHWKVCIDTAIPLQSLLVEVDPVRVCFRTGLSLGRPPAVRKIQCNTVFFQVSAVWLQKCQLCEPEFKNTAIWLGGTVLSASHFCNRMLQNLETTAI